MIRPGLKRAMAVLSQQPRTKDWAVLYFVQVRRGGEGKVWGGEGW
jgi:hypothetical protein